MNSNGRLAHLEYMLIPELSLCQVSLLDSFPVKVAVKELANKGGAEERGLIFTWSEVLNFILDINGYTGDPGQFT